LRRTLVLRGLEEDSFATATKGHPIVEDREDQDRLDIDPGNSIGCDRAP
jgi:hypothetical protein